MGKQNEKHTERPKQKKAIRTAGDNQRGAQKIAIYKIKRHVWQVQHVNRGK